MTEPDEASIARVTDLLAQLIPDKARRDLYFPVESKKAMAREQLFDVDAISGHLEMGPSNVLTAGAAGVLKRALPGAEQGGADGGAGGGGAAAGVSSEHARIIHAATSAVLSVFSYNLAQSTAPSTAPFKQALVARYSNVRQSQFGREIWCMLTNSYLPSELVIAAHLWQRRWDRAAHLLGIDDMDDVRNGLLLFKPLELAFDSSRLCFIYDADWDHFVAYVLDGTLWDVPLADFWPDPDKQPNEDLRQRAADQLRGLTFGQVDGRWLKSYHSHDATRRPDPFKRVLLYQSQAAILYAADMGWQRPAGSVPVPAWTHVSSPGNVDSQLRLDTLMRMHHETGEDEGHDYPQHEYD